MKKILMVGLAILAGTSLIGCQATPKNPIVIGKDQNQMIEQAQTVQTQLPPEYEYPEKLTYSQNENNLSVTADATVTMPDVSAYPIVKMQTQNFSQEQVSGLWDSLVGDTVMYNARPTKTKSDIQAEILELKRYVSESEASRNQEAVVGYESYIKELESAYANAPENHDKTPINSELITSDEGAFTYSHLDASDESGGMVFSVTNNVQAKSTSEPGDGYSGAMLSFYDMESEYEINADYSSPTEGNSNLEITSEEAVNLVDDFLSSNNMGFFNVVSSELLTDFDSEGEDLHTAQQGENYVYEMQCQRIVSDIPVTIVQGASGNSPTQDGSATYYKHWAYEELRFWVNDSGIVHMLWNSPYEVLDTEVENSALLPFSEIESIFQTMIYTKYSGYYVGGDDKPIDIQGEIEVTDVKFEMMRIIEQDSFEHGLFVPVWNFYGYFGMVQNGEDVSSKAVNQLILQINAIDGSVIDSDRGY